MRCPACSLVAFPRLSPAMITLVTRGEPGPDQEALLARGVQWTVPMYSCLAGFVEPGESLEAAVVREVAEEVAIEVDESAVLREPAVAVPQQPDDRFPRRLRIGRDRRATRPRSWTPAGTGVTTLPMVPPGISIARKLIDAWLAE